MYDSELRCCVIDAFTSFLCTVQQHIILRLSMQVSQCSFFNISYRAFVYHRAVGMSVTCMNVSCK